jgi:NTE family protein
MMPSCEEVRAMADPFRNLVFEGGGVKGIAYVGAMEVLEQRGSLARIQRVGGTSAGAINAVLFATGYDNDETTEILKTLDFNNFLDDEWGFVRDARRLVEEYGWYKGRFFREWIGGLVAEKLDNPHATFRELELKTGKHLYLYGTNLSTGFGEVYSNEHTPRMRIADAARISMSIPLFFRAVRNQRDDVFVDGGVLDNYPIKLFDRRKYVDGPKKKNARKTDYYDAENAKLKKLHPDSSPYCYNRETLGFRLDSKREIAIFRDGAERPTHEIDDFFEYAFALVKTIMNAQSNQHLHGDDWQRTVYIDTLDVETTDFDLSDERKQALVASGRKGTKKYFEWYDDLAHDPAVNHPDTPF